MLLHQEATEHFTGVILLYGSLYKCYQEIVPMTEAGGILLEVRLFFQITISVIPLAHGSTTVIVGKAQ